MRRWGTTCQAGKEQLDENPACTGCSLGKLTCSGEGLQACGTCATAQFHRYPGHGRASLPESVCYKELHGNICVCTGPSRYTVYGNGFVQEQSPTQNTEMRLSDTQYFKTQQSTWEISRECLSW